MRISGRHQIVYHRNGVAGEGFWAILFTDASYPHDANEPFNMLATVFEGQGQVSVINTHLLKTAGVTFGVNSFRGDHYEPELRQWIAEAN